jgi:hypothetical protein
LLRDRRLVKAAERTSSTPCIAKRSEKVLGDMTGSKDADKAGRAMQAMMQKLDIAALKRAYDGA